jgi:hypothetical protein
MGRDVLSLPCKISWHAQGQFYLHLTENTRSMKQLLLIYSVTTAQRTHRIIVKMITLVILERTPHFYRNQTEHTDILISQKYRISLQRLFCYILGNTCRLLEEINVTL